MLAMVSDETVSIDDRNRYDVRQSSDKRVKMNDIIQKVYTPKY
jgi:hypothetical protein